MSGLRVRVARWGESLAVRLPSSMVEVLDLKEGDDIEITVAAPREFPVADDRSRAAALRRIRALRRPLPPDWKAERRR